jgi:hypothetical protein
MTVRDEVIRDLAELVADLQVPISMHDMGLAKAQQPWTRLKDRLVGFGWTDADDLEAKLREILS